jgi:transposase
MTRQRKGFSMGASQASPSIFSATLGLTHHWQITSVVFSTTGKRLDITIDFARDTFLICPTCGSRITYSSHDIETWYHQNYFKHQTYLHARVPRIICETCGVISLERPWCREGSRFSIVCATETAPPLPC